MCYAHSVMNTPMVLFVMRALSLWFACNTFLDGYISICYSPLGERAHDLLSLWFACKTFVDGYISICYSPLSERAHDLRMIADERGVDALHLQKQHNNKQEGEKNYPLSLRINITK